MQLQQSREFKIPKEDVTQDAQTAEVTSAEEENDLDLAEDSFVPEEPDAADIEDIMAQISAQQEADTKEHTLNRVPDVVFDEDEEPVTEEDLQAAEAEFLNGPAGVQKPDEPDADLDEEDDGFDEIPSLELEEDETEEAPGIASRKWYHRRYSNCYGGRNSS